LKPYKSIEIKLRPPFNISLTFEATPPAYPSIFEDNCLYRAFRVEGKLIPTMITFKGNVDHPRAEIKVFDEVSERQLREVISLVKRHLCDDLDLKEVYKTMGEGFSWISKELYGLKPWLAPTPFEGIILSIAFQQISIKAALSIIKSLVEQVGDYVEVEGLRFYSFPTPEKLASMSIEDLRKCKLSLNKARYVKALSQEVLKGLSLYKLETLSTRELYDVLTSLKGIGKWTAELALLIAFKRWESLPSDDLGIRKAFAKIIFNKPIASAQEVATYAERWGMYKGPIAYYLLIYYEKFLRHQ